MEWKTTDGWWWVNDGGNDLLLLTGSLGSCGFGASLRLTGLTGSCWPGSECWLVGGRVDMEWVCRDCVCFIEGRAQAAGGAGEKGWILRRRNRVRRYVVCPSGTQVGNLFFLFAAVKKCLGVPHFQLGPWTQTVQHALRM